jgi:hypothetical protein
MTRLPLSSLLLVFALSSTLLSSCNNGPDKTDNESTCVSPTQNVEAAYQCSPALSFCACSAADERREECVTGEDGRLYALRCSEGVWSAVPNSNCTPDSEECFSPKQNVELAQSGVLRGCACDNKDSEVCAESAGLRLPMWCSNGTWEVEPTESGCSINWDLCAGFDIPDAGG